MFDGLANLQVLYAANNSIESLEPGIFVGLESLTELGLGSNGVPGGFVLKPELSRLDDDTFVVEIAEGAPFNVDVTLTVLGGTSSTAECDHYSWYHLERSGDPHPRRVGTYGGRQH